MICRRAELFGILDEIAAKVANALALRIDQTVLSASRRRKTPAARRLRMLAARDGMSPGGAPSSRMKRRARLLSSRRWLADPQYARAAGGTFRSRISMNGAARRGSVGRRRRKPLTSTRDGAEALGPGRRCRAGDPGEDRAISPCSTPAGGGACTAGRLQLAPNDAFVAIQLAMGFALLGEGALAAELGGRALALNPLGPGWWLYYAALPHFVLRDYARPSSLDRKTPTIVTDQPVVSRRRARVSGPAPSARRFTPANFARSSPSALRRAGAAEPGEPLRWLVHVNPFRREEDLRHLTEACASRVLGRNGCRRVAGCRRCQPPWRGRLATRSAKRARCGWSASSMKWRTRRSVRASKTSRATSGATWR